MQGQWQVSDEIEDSASDGAKIRESAWQYLYSCLLDFSN